jgi:hypothetical protein
VLPTVNQKSIGDGELTCTGGIHNGYAAIASVVGMASAMSA